MDRLWNNRAILKCKMIKYLSINHLEKSLFGSKSRFQLKKSQEKEISNDFRNSKILIFGAAGSIGKAFSVKLKKYKINKIVFFDKNENSLADLNREINLNYNSKIKREYICQDLNNFDIKKFLKSENFSHFFNFAALKHVRSEENFQSINYLIKTNCISPFNLGDLNTLRSLKKIFFISTDKVAYPSSLMGCSKKLMEYELFKLKKKFKKKFISTVRFANVAFSNGSLLKNIYEKTLLNYPFGVPDHVKRYFVTHSEAADLCLISLLKESDGSIIVPANNVIGKQKKLKDIAFNIVSKMNKKPIFVKKILRAKSGIQQIVLGKEKIIGQKNKEFFYEKNEKLETFKGDLRVKKIKLYKNNFFEIRKNIFIKAKSINDFFRIFRKLYAIKKKSK